MRSWRLTALSKARLSYSPPVSPSRSVREQLVQHLDLLSEIECEQLLGVVRDVEGGERFWEGDSGVFYDQYVKLRYAKLSRHARDAKASGSEFVAMHLPSKTYRDAERVDLPRPRQLTAALEDCLNKRRSRRDYSNRGL